MKRISSIIFLLYTITGLYPLSGLAKECNNYYTESNQYLIKNNVPGGIDNFRYFIRISPWDKDSISSSIGDVFGLIYYLDNQEIEIVFKGNEEVFQSEYGKINFSASMTDAVISFNHSKNLILHKISSISLRFEASGDIYASITYSNGKKEQYKSFFLIEYIEIRGETSTMVVEEDIEAVEETLAPEEIHCFIDNFNSNTGWPLISDNDKIQKIENRVLTISGKNEKYGYRSVRELYSYSSNYTIQATVMWNSGIRNSAHGLIFSGDHGGQYYAFLVAADGHYKVSSYYNSSWNDITSWKNSSFVYNNPISCILKIEKINNTFWFYINNIFVEKIEISTIYGDYFGFFVGGNQTVSFDDFSITFFD